MKKGINLILIILFLAGLLFSAGCSSTARNTTQPEKVYHVGILCGLTFFADTETGFRQKMTELGYVEGKNIVYESYKMDYDPVAFKKILDKFRDEKVDLVFTFPTSSALLAKEELNGTGIPIVFANSFTDDMGLIDSVRQPGDNITGVRWGGPDIALERYTIMHELSPQTRRMFVMYQSGTAVVKSQIEALDRQAPADGITLVEIPADNATDLTKKLQDQTVNSSGDAILMIAEPLLVTPDGFTVAAKFAGNHHIPLGGAYMAAGGYESLYGVTPQSVPQGREAAVLADKILRGEPAGTIPVVTADNYFQLSYRAAQNQGLNVSPDLLNRADQIIR